MSHGRQILTLALPALGALIAEPLFLAADTAIIGHLGREQLAGGGLGATLMQTAVGLMIFLAYSTTPAVARHLGAGRVRQALSVGRDGMALALLLGAVLATAGFLTTPWLVSLMGADGATHLAATTYLLWSLPGLPAMLLVLAATGVLRGMLDTKTPLLIAGGGFTLNICLNWLLVYGAGMGVAGSALGTSLVQWGMAGVYLWLLLPRARAAGVAIRPRWRGVLGVGLTGSWLMWRTLALRVCILATAWVATAHGPLVLASHQVLVTVFSFFAFVLDALAIAAQALIGRERGSGSLADSAPLIRTMERWSGLFGLITGAVLLLLAPWAAWIFTSDAQVASLIGAGLLVLAASQPLAGLVFILDGILIGAEDAKFLAFAGLIMMAVYLPLLAAAHWTTNPSSTVIAIWLAYGFGLMGARAGTLLLRLRHLTRPPGSPR